MAMGKQARSLFSLLVLALLAAGAGAYAYWGVLKGDNDEQARKEAESKAFEFDKATVKKLSLTAKGATTALERDGDGWRIVAPVVGRADKYAVDPIVDKLADLKSKQVVAEDASKAADFGLDAPQFVVTATCADAAGAEKTLELKVGMENPLDLTLYYAKGGDGRVFQADAALKYPLDKSLFDLRDKAVVTHEDKDVQAVSVEVDGGSWAAERAGEGWRLTAPVADAGDKGAIEGVLSKLRTSRVKAFPAEAGDAAAPAAYGLDKPTAVVTFAVGADRAKKTLQLGEATVDGAKKAFARLVEGGPVMEVEESLAKELAKPASELRDRTVAPFERDAARRLEITPAEGAKLVVRRSKEKTNPDAAFETDKFTVDGVDGTLKTWKLSSALYTLASLKGAAIVAEAAKDLAPYGLDKPAVRFAVFGEGDAPLAEVLVGAAHDGKYYAAKAGSGRVYDVEKGTIDDLPRKTDDLLETPPPAPDAGAAASTSP